ncbi:MAG: hypothetical protein ACFB10_05840 [Salibacteraceae bacterium]
MELQQTIQTLEAMASGTTPEIEFEGYATNLFSEPVGLSALKSAIGLLKKQVNSSSRPIIPKADLELAMVAFREQDLNPSPTRLRAFFRGTGEFANTNLNAHELYGKYHQDKPKDEMLQYLKEFFEAHPTIRFDLEKEPWRAIDFFDKPQFNLMTVADADRLRSTAARFDMVRHNLNVSIRSIRKHYYRSHEPWLKAEEALLRRALAHTNDLSVLSSIFGRSENSLRIKGQQLLWEKGVEKIATPPHLR